MEYKITFLNLRALAKQFDVPLRGEILNDSTMWHFGTGVTIVTKPTSDLGISLDDYIHTSNRLAIKYPSKVLGPHQDPSAELYNKYKAVKEEKRELQKQIEDLKDINTKLRIELDQAKNASIE